MTDLDKMARELLDARPDAAFGVSADFTGHAYVVLESEARCAIRAALLTAPPGWKLVPVELPVEMEVAFCEQWFARRRAIDDPCMQDCWDAALAAAPEVK